MMGEANPQPAFFYNISLETFVAADHPLRAIRPLIDDRAIRRACRDLYSPIGRPSIPPEQLPCPSSRDMPRDLAGCPIADTFRGRPLGDDVNIRIAILTIGTSP